MTENEISRLIVESAIEVHRALGPGLLESTYRQCLACELPKRSCQSIRRKSSPICGCQKFQSDCSSISTLRNYKTALSDSSFRVCFVIFVSFVVRLSLVFQ